MTTSTPWGASQHSRKIATGLVRYGTSSHGGIHVSRTRVESMPPKLRPLAEARGIKSPTGGLWLEEDCDWCFAALAFPNEFPAEYAESAEKTLRMTYPTDWELFFGRKLLPGESTARDREDFYKQHENDLITLSAWGSWAEHVPEGFVGVSVCKGGIWKPDMESSYWLVPQDEYEADRSFGFVVDPSRHQQIDGPLGAHRLKAA